MQVEEEVIEFDEEGRRNQSQKPLEDCPTCEWNPPLYTQTQVNEIDRCARAYGWEIGRGQSINAKIDTTEGNPFIDDNWRVTHGIDEASEGRDQPTR